MTIIQSFVAVWTELGSFLTSIWTSLLSLFYAEGALTFVGVMAVIMAGIALILLAFNLIRSFFAMRG